MSDQQILYYLCIHDKYIVIRITSANPFPSMEKQKPENVNIIILDSLINHVQYLKKFQQDLIGPLCHFTYPSKQLILFYQKQLIPKLKKRKQTNSNIVSDILYWFAPLLVGYVHRIEKYIKNSIKSSESRRSSLKQLMPDLGQECSEQVMLRIPQVFIEETLATEIKSSIKYTKNKELNKEADSLTRFVELYEGMIEKYKKNLELSSQEVQEKVQHELFDDVPQDKRKLGLKYVYRFAFLAKLRIRANKANKNLHQRRMRILQLIDGEKKYISGLQDYIHYIKDPITALNILSKDQELKLFSTIQSIMQIHQFFYEQLQTKYEKYEKYQTYGDIIKKNFPFFQIYTDYVLYADEAQALLIKLAEEHQEIEQICKKYYLEKQKKASDQVKQPTFKIARYEMLLTEIIKKTNPIHPDYQKLIQAQQQGIAGLRKINQTVDKLSRSNRLNQLQQQFGTEQRPIYIQKRQFMQEFSLFFVRDQKLEPVTVYVFSDFVMVIDEHRKILKWVDIDENFYVRREEDNKIYRNIIKIHSEGFLTFSAGSEDKHFNKAEQFYTLLQRVSKENEESSRMVYVQVIGTEEIGSTSFAKHTEYIVEIKYLGLRKYIHIRFSEMKPLVNRIQHHYKNDLNITNEEALHKNWFNNHKSKTIQDRKRTIQQILQKIMNHQVIKKNPGYILEELGLQQNFFTNSSSPQKKRQTMLLQSNLCLTQSKIRPSKKQFKEAETILCATEIKLGRDVFHDIDDIAMLQKKASEIEKTDIYVNTMVQEEPVVLKITESFTVEDVCHKVSKMIGLKMNRDFRLFHEIGKKQLRVLDPEQKIMKIFSFPKSQSTSNGIFSSFFSPLKRIISPDSHPVLIFKKYYFLPVQIEQSESKKDLTRLRLLVYQIFSEIKDMKYQLSFDEYLLFLAMMIYIEYDGDIPDEIPTNFISRLIPETIFKLKNYSQDQWISKCRPHILRIREQIEKIIEFNREQLKLKNIKMDSVSKTALYFGHRHLCSSIVINKIKSNPIYGSNLFYVQPYKSTYQKLQNQGRKMAYNMWLAIKVQSLNLLTPSSKETVLQLKYSQIQKIFVYSEAIIFKMDGIQTEEYRLNTYQSFEISQLVKYNKALNDTLSELQRNQDLISKARMYKQELLIYRNTYDEK